MSIIETQLNIALHYAEFHYAVCRVLFIVVNKNYARRNDTEQNDAQLNDTKHNDAQHNDIQHSNK